MPSPRSIVLWLVIMLLLALWLRLCAHGSPSQGDGAKALIKKTVVVPSKVVELTWTYKETTNNWRSNIVFHVFRKVNSALNWQHLVATTNFMYREQWFDANKVLFAVVASNTVTKQINLPFK
jgi:hypothetical protein